MKNKINYLKGFATEKFDGGLIELSLDKEEISNLPDIDGKIHLQVKKKRELGKYGDTHYVTLNDWRYNNKKTKEEQTPKLNGDMANEFNSLKAPSMDDDELPF